MFAGIVVSIHLTHARSLIREEAGRFRRVTVDQVLPFFPNAVRLGQYDSGLGGQIVYDADGKTLGAAVQTAPLSDDVIGYSGPTNVLIAFSPDDRIVGTAILESEDTDEHVRAVRKDSRFLSTWNGLDRQAARDRRDVDAVSGSTLTALAVEASIVRRLGGNRPSLKFPDPITLAELRPYFPEAASIDREGSKVRVFDAQRKRLGFAVRTSPHADTVLGYQGPTDTLLVFGPDERLVAMAVRRSYDNEPYVGYLADDYYFPSLFTGKTLAELGAMDLEAERVEGISGATMTTMGIARAMVETGRSVSRETVEKKPSPAARWRPSPRDLGTLAVLFGGLIVGFTNLRGHHRVRIAWQIVLVGYLGFLNGDMVSQAFLAGAARNGLPWQSALGLSCLTVAALAVPLVTHRQVYCHHICPHGALQQLVKRRLPWQWSIPPWLQKILSLLPAMLLGAALLAAFRLVDVNLANIEPFDAYLFRIAGWGSLAIAAVGLMVSLFVPMAYCRYGCPTGALLNWIRRNARSDCWSWRDTFATALLAVSVVLLASG